MAISEFERLIPIPEGWSLDKKYKAIKKDGSIYFLRISNISLYQQKLTQFRFQRSAYALKIPMCNPLEFGLCDDGVYILQSWIEGEMAAKVLLHMNTREAYSTGLLAGRMLYKLHSIPAPTPKQAWSLIYQNKIAKKLKSYAECRVKLKELEPFITYIENQKHLLKGRLQTYRHGDYHVGNMMFQGKQLKIIDFDCSGIGDPWEDFNQIADCVRANPTFACGMIDGYFNGSVPRTFWRLLALYIAVNVIGSISWAISYGEQDIKHMVIQAKEILSWYQNMKTFIPNWYEKKEISYEYQKI